MPDSSKKVVVTGDVLIEWRLAESKIRDRGGALFDPYNYMELYRKPVGAVSVGDIIRKSLAGLPSFCDDRLRPRVLAPERSKLNDLAYDSAYWHSYVTCTQFPKRAGKADGETVWRVAEKLGIDRKRVDAQLADLVPGDDGNASLIVVEQSQHGFARQLTQPPKANEKTHGTLAEGLAAVLADPTAEKAWKRAWPKSLKAADTSRKWLLVEWMRPQFTRDHDFWTYVSDEKRFGGRIVVVLTAEDLRLSGMRISRSLSWERTIEDLTCELDRVWSRSLAGCAHLVVSFGTSGAAVFSAGRDGGLGSGKLIFDPSAAEGAWAAQFPGLMSGFTRCITAGTALELIASDFSGNLDGRGARAGVLAARHVLENGFHSYGTQARTDTELPKDLRFPTDSIAALMRTVLAAARDAGQISSTIVKDARARARHLHRERDALGKNAKARDVIRALKRKLDAKEFDVIRNEIELILDDDKGTFTDEDVITRILCLVTPDEQAIRAAKAFVVHDIPPKEKLLPAKGTSPKTKPSKWSILETKYPRGEDDSEYASKIVAAAREIVELGLEGRAWEFPTSQIGDLFLADRDEMETLSAVRELMMNYMSSTGTSKPVSIAVFGAPGSGKSFGIKELAADLSRKGSRSGTSVPAIQSITFNLSQYADAKAVVVALHSVRDISLSGKLPLVFWDEFDTNFGGTPLGWLRYFLAPMQDGQFQDGSMLHNIGRAIFVFAGGTHVGMDAFLAAAKEKNGHEKPGESAAHAKDAEDDDAFSDAAKAAKVPDFLSRLKGFVNVPSLDYIEYGENAKHHITAATALRRAVMLRTNLLSSAANLVQTAAHIDKDGKHVLTDRLNVDSAVTDAFLRIDSFTHGARSMEAIVKMSALSGKDMYDRSSLPPADQLGLHVNAKKFLEYANKGPG